MATRRRLWRPVSCWRHPRRCPTTIPACRLPVDGREPPSRLRVPAGAEAGRQNLEGGTGWLSIRHRHRVSIRRHRAGARLCRVSVFQVPPVPGRPPALRSVRGPSAAGADHKLEAAGRIGESPTSTPEAEAVGARAVHRSLGQGRWITSPLPPSPAARSPSPRRGMRWTRHTQRTSPPASPRSKPPQLTTLA